MKKTIATLLAVGTVFSTSVAAMAADTNVTDIINADIQAALTAAAEETDTTSSEAASSDTSSTDATSSDAASSDTSSTDATSSEAASSDTSSSETAQQPVGEATGFVFGADSSTGATLGTTVLRPGKTYKFPVSLQYVNGVFPMTSSLIDGYKFTYTRQSANSVSDIEFEESKGVYHLTIEVKSGTPKDPIDVKYNIKMVNKSDNLALFTQEVSFQYGYEHADDDYIDGLDKDEVIDIDNSNPIITADQFDTIAELNNYKNVTLAGEDWTFEVNVTDESTKNLHSTNEGIKEILAKYTDNEFKFFNFTAKPQFNATGKLALDVSDIDDDYDNMYVYRYVGGKLYRINATYNNDDNTLEFRTNVLDNYLVTDKLIQDSTVAEGTNAGTNNDIESTEITTTVKPVPSTGACNRTNLRTFLRQLVCKLGNGAC